MFLIYNVFCVLCQFYSNPQLGVTKKKQQQLEACTLLCRIYPFANVLSDDLDWSRGLELQGTWGQTFIHASIFYTAYRGSIVDKMDPIP